MTNDLQPVLPQLLAECASALNAYAQRLEHDELIARDATEQTSAHLQRLLIARLIGRVSMARELATPHSVTTTD